MLRLFGYHYYRVYFVFDKRLSITSDIVALLSNQLYCSMLNFLLRDPTIMDNSITVSHNNHVILQFVLRLTEKLEGREGSAMLTSQVSTYHSSLCDGYKLSVCVLSHSSTHAHTYAHLHSQSFTLLSLAYPCSLIFWPLTFPLSVSPLI